MDRKCLEEYVLNHIGDNLDTIFFNDCKTIEYLFENCDIVMSDSDRFFAKVNCDGIMRSLIEKRTAFIKNKIKDEGLQEGQNVLAFTGLYDYSHTNAGLDDIISLGISGIRDRAREYFLKEGNLQKQEFYNAIYCVYSSAIDFMRRVAKIAEKAKKTEMANGIYRLCIGAPKTLFEAMQTIEIYYVLQQMFDGTVMRTLGRLDTLLLPFYLKDKENAEKLFVDFFEELATFKAVANMPFAIGGTNDNGESAFNELSAVVLRAYKKCASADIKMHILCREDMPENVLKEAFDSVRAGANSIVFMSDKKVIEALAHLGADMEDAIKYHVVGCYECGAEQELTCSCNARINLPKALECALNGGKDMLTGELIGIENDGDFKSFEQLYKEFLRQVKYFCDSAIQITDMYEEHYSKIHCAPILSATYKSAMEKGGDLYCDYAAKYNNSSLNAVGLATVVDSLVAIKELVYTQKKITISQFTEILKNNWADNEALRLTCKNRMEKYGMGSENADGIAKDIVDKLYTFVSGIPNKKGGVYRLGLFSIDWRWSFGRATAASADGRKSRETLSQNTSASFGADKLGATAHLTSAAKLDAVKTPNGHIVDIDLHSSAVEGENGLNALVSTLKTYFDMGGFSVHYNVLDTEVLKKAKENPQDYPNLQVRLCGWNVLFNSLTAKEKDEFIERSIK
ncbi:MAG: pyruvate formate lyase family protein [Acutalibacteraceae bacterium]|nr:pyruvate formate lyase family protein [Acutalibacteraceae bacterium]